MQPMHSKKPGCSGPDCSGCSSPNCMSEGGEVKRSGSEVLSDIEPTQPKLNTEHAKHIAMSAKKHPSDREVDEGYAKQSDLRAQEREAFKEKKRKERGYAEGGEVSGEMHVEDSSPDDEMHDMLGKELMSALHSKDPKAIMPCLEACVLSIMNKGMDDEE